MQILDLNNIDVRLIRITDWSGGTGGSVLN